jgi:multidrug efflux system membrane fusion protein
VRLRLLVFPLLAACLTAGCSRNGAAAPARARGGGEAVPVTVTSVALEPMPIELRVVGTVEPCATVGVGALVGGELTAVHFQEGQEVKKDDILFTIDPRPFEAQLHQAEANLARDTAQAENANAQARRYRDLVGRGIATREQLDQISTNAAALQATVKADAAAVENANLQLQYSTIRAPIDGRTGALLVQAGNLVRTTDTTPLVVINEISPIYVAFSVPEASLPDLRRYEAAGSLRVDVAVPGAQAPVERGRISFIDNTVDRSTGTIRVKGTFQNPDRHLWPGLFVNVVLTLKTEPRAIVVPLRAVQEAQEGKYVYVVKGDRTVESRPVTIARTVGDRAIIATGLTAGETVVTDGQLRLVPGTRVSIDRPAADTKADRR